MAWMLELSDRILSTTTINILRDLLEKGNEFEQMGNTCYLSITIPMEMKIMISEIRNKEFILWL